MKILLFMFILLFPIQSIAKDKIWFSNKVEVGYGKVFVGEKITFENNVFSKNSFIAGLKFKISENAGYRTYYHLENSKKHNWTASHFFGAAFCFQFR